MAYGSRTFLRKRPTKPLKGEQYVIQVIQTLRSLRAHVALRRIVEQEVVDVQIPGRCGDVRLRTACRIGVVLRQPPPVRHCTFDLCGPTPRKERARPGAADDDRILVLSTFRLIGEPEQFALNPCEQVGALCLELLLGILLFRQVASSKKVLGFTHDSSYERPAGCRDGNTILYFANFAYEPRDTTYACAARLIVIFSSV